MPDAVTAESVLVARGPVSDPDAVRAQWDDWHERVASGTSGWLASTGGITSGGQWLAAVRFTSDEAAADAAGARTGLLAAASSVELTGDVQLVAGNGSPAKAGFVQVMRARVPDRRGFEEVEAALGDRFAAFRRDFLAGLRAWTGPDRLTVVDWFTSEADARAGEAIAIPDDLKEPFARWMSLLHDVEWNDLAQPWQVTR